MYVLTFYVLYRSMVMTRGGAGGSVSRSGSVTGTEPIDEVLRDFIASKIMRGILDATPMMFGTIKERINEMMEEHLQAFRADLSVRQYGSHTLIFKDFRGCGAPEFFKVNDPIVARWWISDIECVQMTRFCLEGSKVRFVVGCLRKQAQDW